MACWLLSLSSLSLLLLLPILTVTIQQEILYVEPTKGDRCTSSESPCQTLDQYAVDLDPYDLSNKTFYFLPGTHDLSYTLQGINTFNLYIQGMGNMIQGPDETVMQSPAIIQCANGEGITFTTVENLTIANLTFINCGYHYNESNLTTAIYMINADQVTLTHISIQNSPYYALFLVDIAIGVITHSSFYNNNIASDNQTSAVSFFYGKLTSVNNPNWYLNISYSNITYNKQSGIFITLVETTIYTTNLNFDSIIVSNNELSNLHIGCNTTLFNLNMNNINISYGLVGFQIIMNMVGLTSYSFNPHIYITNSVVTHNQVFGTNAYLVGSANVELYIESSLIQSNAGVYGSALQVVAENNLQDITDLFQVFLNNVTFDNNRINHTFVELSKVTPSFAVTVGFLNIKNLTVTNCTFSNNEGTALAFYNTFVTFFDNNTFINNIGYNGGGLLIVGNSYIFLSSNTLLSFINNHAQHRGGAINVDQLVLTVVSTNDRVVTFCFYQFLRGTNSSSEKTYFNFNNNTAGVAGDVLYGGATDNCILGDGAVATNGRFSMISNFINQHGLSIISSDARDVCFCDNSTPICGQGPITRSVFPGQSVSFDVIVVGQHNNATTGVVSVSSINTKSNHNVSYAKCATIDHTVRVTNHTQRTIDLTVTLSSTSTQTNFVPTPVTVQVNIQQCPVGFELQNDVCTCSQNIRNVTLNCSAVTGEITRDGTDWLAYYNNESCLIINRQCPFDYCNIDAVTLTLSEPDLQCAFNRSGILCGQCSSGLSLMLGSNQCGECTSNDYLALIIPFALAGIVLVVILIVLNLTVTVGTINGLLFFANVIKIYQPLFFGRENIPFLSQFISWLNLDLGIETCFFTEMNSCAKAGLQFIFPFYLWIIIILIIALSYRFSKLAALIGNKSVPLLCTLLLLSYTKLLRAILSIFSYITTPCTTGPLWNTDANIPYLTGCHLGLFIVALVILLGLFIPYTLFLLLFPLWQLCRTKYSFGTSLYLKLKPFYDAYSGPHSDLLRFWPGLLIVARIVLALTVATATSFNAPLSVLVAILVILIVSLSFGKVYKEGSYLHILDLSFLLCLLVILYLILGTLQETVAIFTFEQAKIGVGVILALTFIAFIGIIVYHIYCIRWVKDVIEKIRKKHKSYSTLQEENPNGVPSIVELINSTRDSDTPISVAGKRVSKSVVSIPELREPLLDSDSYK